MINEKVVTIIIPAYNAEKYIEESIQSILNQTYTNWELLIADDKSTDNTKKIIDNYNDKRIKKFHNERNLGAFQTMNKLLALSTGDYITFQGADDTSSPTRIESQIKAFSEDEELGIVGTWGDIVSENGKWTDDIRRPVSNEEIKANNPISNTFLSATAMIRKDIYEKVGGFRPYLYGFGSQDYDWTSIISEQYKSKNIAQPLYQYRQVTTSISKNISSKRQVSQELVHFLMKRRKENNGLDYLHTGETDIVNAYLEKLLQPYNKDKTLIYREYASRYMYAGLKRNAIKISWKASLLEPYKLINWRTLLYCLRKSIL